MSQLTTDSTVIAEVRRLRLERSAMQRELEGKQRELADLDKSIDRLLGVNNDEDRPRRPALTAKEFALRCRQ